MPVPEEIRSLTQEVVSSFGSGIEAVGVLIEKGLDILDGYRREGEAVRGSLRESLASVSTLRKKDFDEVIERVLIFQAQKEGEIKTLIKGFLKRQKELTGKLKRSIEAGVFHEVGRIKEELALMIEYSRREILCFQKEQSVIRGVFAELEARKEAITFKEFKNVIEDLERKLKINDELLTENPQQIAVG